MAAKLEQNKEVAYLSYQLATIKTDVELELTCEQLEVQQPAAEELLGLFKSMSSNAGLLMSKRANGYRPKGQTSREATGNQCCRRSTRSDGNGDFL